MFVPLAQSRLPAPATGLNVPPSTLYSSTTFGTVPSPLVPLLQAQVTALFVSPTYHFSADNGDDTLVKEGRILNGADTALNSVPVMMVILLILIAPVSETFLAAPMIPAGQA